MRKNPVTRKYLRQITSDYCTAMANALPDYVEDNFTYTDEFNRKMQLLFRKYRRYEMIETAKKYIAAIFAAAIVGSGVWLTFDADARAALVNWVRQIYENSIVYKYCGERETDVLPVYELQYVPDGFVEMDEYEDDKRYFIFYSKPETEQILIFEYGFINESNTISVQDIELNVVSEKITLNEYDVEYYCANNLSKANCLIWFDNKNGIIFKIDSNMNKHEILDIFESVVLIGSGK